MTKEQRDLLIELKNASNRGIFAVACDDRTRRKAAHDLEKLGLADWKGESWGSQFWSVTQKGIQYVC